MAVNRDQSDWINEFFAKASRELTPLPLRHAVHVLYVPISHDPEVTMRCATVLSDTELHRADRFASQGDKLLFLQRRAFRRFCGALALGSSKPLSRIDFKENENGRPQLSNRPDICFSFSSCRFGILGAWSSTHGIGVDLEDQTRELEAVALAHQFFSGAEASVVETAGELERLQTFYRFWSLKEAALKSIGKGLPFGLDAFEFELYPNPRIINAPLDHGGSVHFAAHVIRDTGNCAALVTRNLS